MVYLLNWLIRHPLHIGFASQRCVRMVKMQGAEAEGAGSVLKYMTKSEAPRSRLAIMTRLCLLHSVFLDSLQQFQVLFCLGQSGLGSLREEGLGIGIALLQKRQHAAGMDGFHAVT